ncbi:hypothetical protein SODALDRAFT_375856 [Sodiomyces alkalinus F11]|uniref:Rap-GAP domain-containing protein n=1 Tax=Sodiomyces alkalinus (strain CBS 110278 / VKM F-3762 / F11) TaxID=1314773 RepID=A0A3N2QAH2_SODAK|nr:hypothetical protein SODALDRAFT_375856 [Sodiomyces alkalinus F11]ROT43717.1 hypothetical protein SODALDRAFT_375856 [Sodiomyces alkalinus F11]
MSVLEAGWSGVSTNQGGRIFHDDDRIRVNAGTSPDILHCLVPLVINLPHKDTPVLTCKPQKQRYLSPALANSTLLFHHYILLSRTVVSVTYSIAVRDRPALLTKVYDHFRKADQASRISQPSYSTTGHLTTKESARSTPSGQIESMHSLLSITSRMPLVICLEVDTAVDFLLPCPPQGDIPRGLFKSERQVEHMPPSPGDVASSPDSSRPGGLANVFKGLTGGRLARSPPPNLQSPPSTSVSSMVHPPITIGISGLSLDHTASLQQLKTGSLPERIAAADSLRYAIAEYPLCPVIQIWYAGKDLIDAAKPGSARAAGWDLLTECVKHGSATDLERKEFFQTLTAPAHPEDFHLQLAALVDLTKNGRDLSGFDYEVIPLLRRWLHEAYRAVRVARKQASREAKKNGKSRASVAGEEKNLQQLFVFIVHVIKFSSSVADEPTMAGLVNVLVAICLSTNVEEHIQACIGVIDTIFTFASLPDESFKQCVLLMSSIFCLVPGLHKPAWHTLTIMLKSHHGHATVRVLLDLLASLPADGSSRGKQTRDIRGALAVIEKLLSKGLDKAYPAIPFAPLVDALAAAVRSTPSGRVHCAVLKLINSLFDKGDGTLHPLIVEEDWNAVLAVAADCFQKTPPSAAAGFILVDADAMSISTTSFDSDQPDDAIRRELLRLVARLEQLMTNKTAEFVPRQVVIDFLKDMHTLLPDSTVRVVLAYFQEFRCCCPSDPEWEEHVALVRQSFFFNRRRSSEIRLLALELITEAYEMMELVGEDMGEECVPRLIKDTLSGIAEETDISILEALVSLTVDVAVAAGLELFNYIICTLEAVVANDRFVSPVPMAGHPSTIAAAPSPDGDRLSPDPEKTISVVVTKGYVKLFMRCMNTDGVKGGRLFEVLVNVARAPHCKTSARILAMELLFRLRADWTGCVFLTLDTECDGLASCLHRTEAAMARKQNGDASQANRSSRADYGAPSRSSRAVSFSHAGPHDRTQALRSASGNKQPAPTYKPLWLLSDSGALPEPPSSIASTVLVSHSAPVDRFLSNSDEASDTGKPVTQVVALNVAAWLESVIHIFEHGANWEVYSMVLVYLPSQLSNHAFFRGALSQVQDLRRLLCEQIRLNAFQEAPIATGLRRADVAICLFHSLTMILSYHEHFQKDQEDEIVRAFVHGISTWERCAKYCIHALTICCHELPLSTSKCLVQMLQKMSQIITQPHVAMHILEFLAGLSRLHNLYVNFREDEYRIVFGICMRYLQYVRDKTQSQRAGETPTATTTPMPTPGLTPPNAADGVHPSATDDLPQYVYALAHHVITFWFLALKLPDRANHVGWIAKNLFTEVDAMPSAEEQAMVTIDFMQRVTYADAGESCPDPLFTKERFGDIQTRRWLMGNSIVAIEQATATGWAQITKRQPSGTSSYIIRENFRPPPAHQIQNTPDATRDVGQNQSVLPSHLMVQLMTTIPQTFEALRPVPLPDDDAVQRSLRVFDRLATVDGHKVGVIYVGEGQTEEAEILANVSGSSDYLAFLEGLGTLTELKDAKFNTQGLDKTSDVDGQYTFCWRDKVTEMVFHVTTQMPTRLETDPQCIHKKRHIGNDFVNIIFNDSGLPFKFDTFPSDFNYVNIVITPESRASFVASREAPPPGKEKRMPFYKVQLLSKPGFPVISPASETKMVSLKALPSSTRLLALNASVFSHVWSNRGGADNVSSWRNRLREIRRLREKYGPRVANGMVPQEGVAALGGHGHLNSSASPSSPAAAFGAHGGILGAASHSQAAPESSRPGSSVRDSFGSSLRRSSVATFFTGTSEQVSQRNSLLSSTMTTMHDADAAPANGLDSLVESLPAWRLCCSYSEIHIRPKHLEDERTLSPHTNVKLYGNYPCGVSVFAGPVTTRFVRSSILLGFGFGTLEDPQTRFREKTDVYTFMAVGKIAAKFTDAVYPAERRTGRFDRVS